MKTVFCRVRVCLMAEEISVSVVMLDDWQIESALCVGSGGAVISR